MKTNTKTKSTPIYTHEGGKAVNVNDYQKLRRSVLSSLLFENSFYEDGVSIAERIKNLVPKCNPEQVQQLAIEARTKYKLRHMPLFLTRELARNPNSRYVVADTLVNVIQRADELAEFLSLYWADGKQPLANSVKRGLARAFTKFNELGLAKYNQNNAIKLRDVLFLCRAKPIDKEQANLWKRLIENKLETPDIWETELAAGQGVNKKESWERLLAEDKLGALALLRNLRNFKENNVNEDLIINALNRMKVERVLPYRFIAAARYYPGLEAQLEQAMFKCVENYSKVNGKTVLLIDVSGSMDHRLSNKSDMSRLEAACGLAILARELCPNVKVYTFSRELIEVPNRRGFALRDSIINSQAHRDTFMGDAITGLNNLEGYERLIVFTDEQSAQTVPNPLSQNAYMVNVSNEQNGIGYRNNWTHIDGFSEAIFDFIVEMEQWGE